MAIFQFLNNKSMLILQSGYFTNSNGFQFKLKTNVVIALICRKGGILEMFLYNIIFIKGNHHNMY